jgi:hypothetical protein
MEHKVESVRRRGRRPGGHDRYRGRLGKAPGTCAGEVMTEPVITIPLGTTVVAAARLMVRLGVRRLPVVDARGKLVGIVTRTDLLKLFEPAFGLVLRPEIAALSMSGSSFIVAVNALALKRLRLPAWSPGTGQPRPASQPAPEPVG